MHEPEFRALRRAVVVLAVVSCVRWAWSRAPDRDPGAGDVLQTLLEESRVETEEAERRSRPLAPGERIDPNRADEIELDRLPGVGPATALAIVEAREAGEVFRTPEDLVVVPGIGQASVAKLRDLLDTSDPPRARRKRAGSPLPVGLSEELVDVNSAGTEELQRLPGIGPALADRIVAERRERPFDSVDDLVRVPGIGPATVSRLRESARVGGGA